MCAVYRSFYAHLRYNREWAFLRSATAPAGDDVRSPSTFVEREWSVMAGHAVYVKVDTSAYDAPIRSDEAVFIRGCFEGRKRPRFYDGLALWLAAREYLIGDNDDRKVHLWLLSPIGFSPDGKRALLFAEIVCHGWCACFGSCGAGFFLFEKRDRWMLLGTSLTRVT
jgi:hypothetical protein